MAGFVSIWAEAIFFWLSDRFYFFHSCLGQASERASGGLWGVFRALSAHAERLVMSFEAGREAGLRAASLSSGI